MDQNRQSSRQLKAANLIKQSLVNVFTRGKKLDEVLLRNKITITRVEISADLKNAHCYFLPFGSNIANRDKIIQAIEQSKFAIRKQVTEDINLKFSPELTFFYDFGLENSSEVENVLKRLHDL